MGPLTRMNNPNPLLGVDPLDALRVLVAECEAGNLKVCDLSVEMFREPQGYRDIGNSFERRLVPMDQSMEIKLRILPTGRGGSRPDYSAAVSAYDPDDGPLMPDSSRFTKDSPLTPNGDVNILASPSPEADAAQDRREARKPMTPAGASASRDIIFDDEDGSDPT